MEAETDMMSATSTLVLLVVASGELRLTAGAPPGVGHVVQFEGSSRELGVGLRTDGTQQLVSGLCDAILHAARVPHTFRGWFHSLYLCWKRSHNHDLSICCTENTHNRNKLKIRF